MVASRWEIGETDEGGKSFKATFLFSLKSNRAWHLLKTDIDNNGDKYNLFELVLKTSPMRCWETHIPKQAQEGIALGIITSTISSRGINKKDK